MLILPDNEYGELPPSMQHVHWRVDKVEENLKIEITERKETDKIIFEKFDKMNSMIIYQLCAAILTLVVVVAMFVLK